MASTLQNTDSKVAALVVTLETPTLLWIELHTQLSVETANTEVDCVMVVEAGNLGAQEHILV